MRGFIHTYRNFSCTSVDFGLSYSFPSVHLRMALKLQVILLYSECHFQRDTGCATIAKSTEHTLRSIPAQDKLLQCHISGRLSRDLCRCFGSYFEAIASLGELSRNSMLSSPCNSFLPHYCNDNS